jgi:hypothetical protein
MSKYITHIQYSIFSPRHNYYPQERTNENWTSCNYDIIRQKKKQQARRRVRPGVPRAGIHPVVGFGQAGRHERRRRRQALARARGSWLRTTPATAHASRCCVLPAKNHFPAIHLHTVSAGTNATKGALDGHPLFISVGLPRFPFISMHTCYHAFWLFFFDNEVSCRSTFLSASSFTISLFLFVGNIWAIDRCCDTVKVFVGSTRETDSFVEVGKEFQRRNTFRWNMEGWSCTRKWTKTQKVWNGSMHIFLLLLLCITHE